MTAHGLPEQFNAADYFVDRHVREGRGGRIAIECGDDRITYAELAGHVVRFGRALRTQFGVRREERVLLWLLDGPAFFYAYWGAIRIGAVPVPVNTMWTAQDLGYVLSDCRARVAVVSAALWPTFASIPQERRAAVEHVVIADGTAMPGTHDLADVIARGGEHVRRRRAVRSDGSEAVRSDGSEAVRSDGSEAVRSDGTSVPSAPTSPDDAALWLYSSGSTGAPKGCVHLHHDMVVCASSYARHVLGITEHDRCFSVAKLFFAYGLGNAGYFPLSVGGTAILWPGAPTAANVYAVIERHRPTLLFSVPTNYGMLLAHHRAGGERDFDLSSLRLAISAGEALPPALFERFKERFGLEILDGIGSTETLHMFISNRAGRVRPGSSGEVIPGYEARLVDEQGDDVPCGEIGNLLIKGDSTCAMYWNQHERTKATIEGHWIRTGDKYSRDEDGYYWHAGRSDDMLKVGGIWVSPVEVENVLMEHPAVKECAVVGHLDHDRLVKPVAFVVPAAGAEPGPPLEGELQQFVRARLADYKRPRWIRFLSELPKTATGKTQRFKLRQ